MTIAKDIFIVSNGGNNGGNNNIEFETNLNSASSLICNMPCSIRAQDSTSNISINTPVILKRNTNLHSEFHIYAGNTFACKSNSNGISMIDISTYGATINIEANDIQFDTQTCTINTDFDNSAVATNAGQDIIWFHPTPLNNSNIYRNEL